MKFIVSLSDGRVVADFVYPRQDKAGRVRPPDTLLGEVGYAPLVHALTSTDRGRARAFTDRTAAEHVASHVGGRVEEAP